MARRPWSPHPSWADPLIVALALFCLMGSSLALRQRQGKAAPTASGPTVQGRIIEVLLGARVAFGAGATGGSVASLGRDLPNPSDRAVAAVLLAESGQVPEAQALLARAPQPSPAFQRAFEAAYLQAASAEAPRDLPTDLGDGLALRLLRARLAPEAERQALRRSALSAWTRRFALLACVGLGTTLLVLGGLATALWLMAVRQGWPTLPAWSMPGRALLLVFLGWFSAYFLSAIAMQLLGTAWTAFRPFALPLGYALHAGAGTFLLCRAEGISFAELRQRVCPGRPLKSLALAPPFVGLGLGAVLLMGMILSPLLRGRGNPQQELLEGLRQLKGWGPVLLMFLTVAVLAPLFEELMMRGLLMGWLRSRKGPALALVVSALVFGAMHLQPLAMPTLSLLGAAFGLGVMRSGDLRTSILAHGIWNGSLFLLLRLLA